MNRKILLLAFIATFSSGSAWSQDPTAWNPGFPEAGLNPAARTLIAEFKQKAASLQQTKQKLRILIIGDSLSDGYYHWSHYLRSDLQKAYGNGGVGNVNANAAFNGRDSIPGWLFKQGVDYDIGITGKWRIGWGMRDEVWPYLGWNNNFLSSDDSKAELTLTAQAASITTVFTTGNFVTFDGHSVLNHAAGFTIDTDGKAVEIPVSPKNAPLDVGLARTTLPQGKHTVHVKNIHDGWLWIHGFLLENDTPGVVVYNIARGGWWPYNFIWRQPGFEKTLQAMNPDYIIYFLSKPDSDSTDRTLAELGTEPDYARMMTRITAALPKAKTLHILGWGARGGSSPQDIEATKRRRAFFEKSNYAVLDFNTGLNTEQMDKLGWYKDGIHLAQPGGEGIGHPVSDLFLPVSTEPKN